MKDEANQIRKCIIPHTVQKNKPPCLVIYDFIREEWLLKIWNILTKIYTAGQWQRPQLPRDAWTQAQCCLRGPLFSRIEYCCKKLSSTYLHFRLLLWFHVSSVSMTSMLVTGLFWSKLHQFYLLYVSNINHHHKWGLIKHYLCIYYWW